MSVQLTKKLVCLFLGLSIIQTAYSAPSCSIQTRKDMRFGVYNPLAFTNTQSTGRIRIRCRRRGTVNYQISFSTGNSNNFNNRTMSNLAAPSSLLNYNLYRNSGRTIILGDGTGTTVTFSDTRSSPFRKNHTVYGKIPSHQTTVQPGSYSDTIIVTLDY